MARIAYFKVEVPVSDRASNTAIKAMLQEKIRGLGTVDVAVAPDTDPALLDDDRTAFFASTSVKHWVSSPVVKRAPKVAA